MQRAKLKWSGKFDTFVVMFTWLHNRPFSNFHTPVYYQHGDQQHGKYELQVSHLFFFKEEKLKYVNL